MFVLIGREGETEVSSPAILGVLIMNGVVCGRCLFLSPSIGVCLLPRPARTCFVAATIYEAVAHRLGSGALYFF